jgi:phage terminase small subunit
VDSLPPDRFHKSDRPLLALYCRHLHQAHVALAKIEEHGACDGESLNPWLKVAEAATKQCAVLATKLRLAPQSRLDRKVAGPAARGSGATPPPWEA